MDQVHPHPPDQDRQQGLQQTQSKPIPPQFLIPPQQPVVPLVPTVPQQLVPPTDMAMDCSYLKPECSGKPQEGSQANLLITVDLMDTHNFATDQSVRRFPFKPNR